MERCPSCGSKIRKVKVNIQDADEPVLSYQCAKCDYFGFDDKSMGKAIKSIKLKEAPLMIKQKIIKLSKDRLGMYINRDVARSLELKAGDDVYVSVPDKGHILIKVES
jgi:DNA-directed RNA polymerase subunit RPC12/RpoP